MSDTNLNLDLDPSALAALGEGHVAYVRAMRSEE
ncbi:NADH oxidase, partial [Methylobacterium frigidaeris]